MTRAHSRQYSCALWCLLLCLALPGCGPVDVIKEEPAPPEESLPIEQAVRVLATAASAHPDESMPPTTAEIVDVIDGGRSGEWGVKVYFPNGTGAGCFIEVADRRRGDLLASDEINNSADQSYEHITRFRYRGSRTNLRVRVTEKQSGAALADFGS